KLRPGGSMFVRRRVLPIVLIACLTAALLSTAALGAGKNSTKIVVSLKFPAFHGPSSPPRVPCLGSRRVKMYRERNGQKKLLGSDKSEDNGNWAIPVGKKLTS